MGQRARADAPMIRVILSGHQGQWVVGGPVGSGRSDSHLCASCVHNWRYGWCAPGSAPPYPHIVLCVRFTDEI